MPVPTEAEKLARCARVAAMLKHDNPTLSFHYNESSVVLRNEQGRLSMLYSWTITHHFLDLGDKPLDVTDYVKPETLKAA